MRTLKAITIIMAVLIIVGTATLAVLIAKRLAGPPSMTGAEVAIRLDEPPASEIAAIASEGPDQVALLLHGGGPDRVVVVDLAHARVRARIGVNR
ncbi:MAG: hypothetical protein LGL72_09210 [Acidibrevibacterium sp.]|jgi:hypothetical protein|uniref:hypothetical protein n=1 Tax=Acidibrevibacterium fodinaquatile TaxID=1969806 RepID=UPI000E0D3AD6|nr:hypothetical protein [Acidibrevibacterium fodinaquatile]MCA7119571.1 hypothetical protein [Acidibrevibacterium fodinaquatile]